jgi:hypothetical protein
MGHGLSEAPSFPGWRDKDKNEVDVVVEDLAGQLVGIEVKASATARGQDFRGQIVPGNTSRRCVPES